MLSTHSPWVVIFALALNDSDEILLDAVMSSQSLKKMLLGCFKIKSAVSCFLVLSFFFLKEINKS